MLLTDSKAWNATRKDLVPYYFGENGVYRRRLTKLLDISKPPYSTRYPGLVDWMDLMPDSLTYTGMRPRRNVLEDNVVVSYGETFMLTGMFAQCTMRNNFITTQDPGFIDAENLNFQLADDSIVYDKIPGFKHIPFDKIGLFTDEYRTTGKTSKPSSTGARYAPDTNSK